MADKDLLSLNIVLMPPKQVSDFAIALCSEIAIKNSVNFNLDGVNNFPHITIYQLIIPKKNLKILLAALETITSETENQLFKFTKFSTHSGFVGASFVATSSIKAVQEKVVKMVASLTEGRRVVAKNDSRIKAFPKIQKEIVNKYGFDNLFEFYDPHVTITCLKDTKTQEGIAKQLNWPFGQFQVSSIGLYKLGKYGTCNKLIKEFKLKAAG